MALRELANECYNMCSARGMKIKPEMEFSKNEEECVNRCTLRVKAMQKVVDRHVDEQFNPVFMSKYL